jgi:hypothetical protein
MRVAAILSIHANFLTLESADYLVGADSRCGLSSSNVDTLVTIRQPRRNTRYVMIDRATKERHIVAVNSRSSSG